MSGVDLIECATELFPRNSQRSAQRIISLVCQLGRRHGIADPLLPTEQALLARSQRDARFVEMIFPLRQRELEPNQTRELFADEPFSFGACQLGRLQSALSVLLRLARVTQFVRLFRLRGLDSSAVREQQLVPLRLR